MAYHTWHNYGYGICVDEIEVNSPARIEALLEKAPDYREKVHNCLKANGITEPRVEDYFEFVDDCEYGFASILSEVMSETTGVWFDACDDTEDKEYLIYMPRYPWNMDEKDMELTEEKVKEFIQEYVSIISDTKIVVELQSIENGG